MTNPGIIGRWVYNIISTARAKPIGIGIGIGVAIEIGSYIDSDSDTDPDNAVRAALSGSQIKASGFASGYLLIK